MSVSVPQQTLYPAQSIFSEVQAIHDTGVFYSRESEEQGGTTTTVPTSMSETNAPDFFVSSTEQESTRACVFAAATSQTRVGLGSP